MYYLRLKFGQSTNIQIYIPDLSLYNFSCRQLQHYIIEKREIVGKKINNIIIQTSDKHHFKSQDNLCIGQNITIRNNALTCKMNLFGLNCNFEFNLESDLKIIINAKRNLRSRINPFNQYAKNHSHFYACILLPILAVQALHGKTSLIHGSFLTKDSENIILFGLAGVGKSTLAHNLIQKDYHLISDNFILLVNEKVFPLIMPLRFSSGDRIIDNANVVFQNKKLIEVLPPKKEISNGAIDNIAFLMTGQKFQINQNLHITLNQLEKISAIAPEIKEANKILEITELIRSLSIGNRQEIKCSEQIFNCTELIVPIGELGKAINFIEK